MPVLPLQLSMCAAFLNCVHTATVCRAGLLRHRQHGQRQFVRPHQRLRLRHRLQPVPDGRSADDQDPAAFPAGRLLCTGCGNGHKGELTEFQADLHSLPLLNRLDE